MALKTTQEQLEEVQAAISAVCSGQAYSINGRSLTRADLDALTAREDKLLARYKSETGTGGMAVNYGVTNKGY